MNIRHTLVLAVVLALVAGYFFFFQPSRTSPREQPAVWFYAVAPEDIRFVRIRHGGEEASFAKTDLGWVFADRPSLPVNPSRWSGITVLLSGPRARRVLAPQVEDPARYGLDRPRTEVFLRLTGDRQVRVFLGDNTPDGLSTYAVLEGQPQLFLIDASWGEVLSRLVTEPPYPFWYIRGLDPERVAYIRVKVGESQVALTRDADGNWVFDDAQRSPVDPERWQGEFLPLLRGPAELEVVDLKPERPEWYGVKETDTTLMLRYRLPRRIGNRSYADVVLRIGHQTEDGKGYYAQPEGEDALLRLDRAWVDGMEALALRPPRR